MEALDQFTSGLDDRSALLQEMWCRGSGSGGSRWDFHQHKANRMTDLNRGSGRDKLFVKLWKDEAQQATFSLCSLSFPLGELFATFAEQIGRPISELGFTFNEAQLSHSATPRLCGMSPCDLTRAHLIEVREASSLQQRLQVFRALNAMGAINLGEKESTSASLSAPLLCKALLGLPLQELLGTTMVNSYWFRATQRLSLMMQFHHGDFAWMEAECYPEWLVNVSDHSWHLAAADARARREEAELWRGLNVAKEMDLHPVYRLAKAAGCTQMKTVSLDALPQSFSEQWLDLHTRRTEFMAQLQAVSGKGQQQAPWRRPPLEQMAAAAGERASQDEDQAQLLPPRGVSAGFVATAVSSHFKALAVELYRRYFSPDMYYIFPLMVEQQAAFGLDFISTETTLVFGASEEGRPAAPSGAVSWRLRQPVTCAGSGREAVGGPVATLEVLFISVWEEDRHHDLGGQLVDWLVEQAKARGAAILYVEVGYEQPKAQEFWGKHGFERLRRESPEVCVSCGQPPAEGSGERELPASQVAFFDGNCLRFRDTQQYVRVLC